MRTTWATRTSRPRRWARGRRREVDEAIAATAPRVVCTRSTAGRIADASSSSSSRVSSRPASSSERVPNGVADAFAAGDGPLFATPTTSGTHGATRSSVSRPKRATPPGALGVTAVARRRNGPAPSARSAGQNGNVCPSAATPTWRRSPVSISAAAARTARANPPPPRAPPPPPSPSAPSRDPSRARRPPRERRGSPRAREAPRARDPPRRPPPTPRREASTRRTTHSSAHRRRSSAHRRRSSAGRQQPRAGRHPLRHPLWHPLWHPLRPSRAGRARGEWEGRVGGGERRGGVARKRDETRSVVRRAYDEFDAAGAARRARFDETFANLHRCGGLRCRGELGEVRGVAVGGRARATAD